MKSFYKIIFAFILCFCIGLFISFLSINISLTDTSSDHFITELPSSHFYKTTRVG